ncbi:DUF559 domain-containing protein [Brevibacterium permense]|uniref:DUF559 domain-containing protein n=1 Tax=Brevibacterium permense TaxID=234834 RepID=A0ABP4LK66_9MICO|nr:DUF559 domain-containing protein [Brevibacterium permense]
MRRDIRVDFCHRRARLIIEIDGIGKLYLGSGVPRHELEQERRREQWLRDQGRQVIRISWKELFEEAKFYDILRATCRPIGRVSSRAVAGNSYRCSAAPHPQ